MGDDRIRPFSNGAQFGDWCSSNCERCTKSANQTDDPGPPTCQIEAALHEAYFLDGTVSADIARRMAFPGHAARYGWPCGEVDWTPEWKAEWLERHPEAEASNP